jgi:hypothetical protein
MGSGFNLISLPDKHENKPFRLKLNATQKTLAFNRIGAPIPNRGSGQDDIEFLGLHCLQLINDAQDHSALHLEPGIWLNVHATTDPKADPSVVRMATIPHGDSLLSQGTSITVAGGPKIDPVDSTPFTLDPATGARKNDTNPQYLAPFQSTPLPPGKPAGSIANPNLVLTEAIKSRKIVNTVVLFVSADPVGDINGTPVAPPSTPNDIGGIVNVPFVIKNANANSFSAIFWIETVEQSSSLSLLATAVYADSHLGFHWSQVAAHLGGDTSQAIGGLSKSVARLKAPKGVEKSRLDAPCQPRIHN